MRDIDYYRLPGVNQFAWDLMTTDYAVKVGLPEPVRLAAQQFCEAVNDVWPITSRQIAALMLVSGFGHAIAMNEVAHGK